MKTDIFKDLVPLSNMSDKELEELAIGILSECPNVIDRVRLLKLIRRTELLFANIKTKL